MHRSLSRWTVALFIVVAAATLIWHELSLAANGKLTVRFLPVGEGAATLVTTPSGKRILVDGGPDLTVLEELGRFLPIAARSIDLLILSHPHADHVAALPEVMKRYRVKSVLLNGIEHTLPRYQAFLSFIEQQRIPIVIADPAEDFSVGDDVMIDILWPPDVHSSVFPNDLNEASLALRILYGKTAVLLPGDIGFASERVLLSSEEDLSATVMELPHHGSRLSSSTDFLLAVHPDAVIVSSDPEGRYPHPHPEVISRLKALSIPLLSLHETGTATFTSDGLHASLSY
ncbi:MAG: MBL fold metallo-hydrolase [Candidatus Peribacteraceae bacterium]|nr:MBL fold metallo-hydrolase [Candidatus Peribacteraceae bacterium]